MKVLIVDDHAVVRHGLKSAIQSHGYEVVAEAGSINEAQAFMAQTNPDALIVDINLPDGSGFDLVAWSRRVSPTTAIVVLTLNDGADYVRAAKNAGANTVIVANLYISVSTVKTHVSSILRKLDADNRVQALSIARERGLLV